MESKKTIPLIELSGTYQEMGTQFGRAYKTQIHQLAKSRMQRLVNFVKRYGKINIAEHEVLAACTDLLEVHANYDQDSWDEFSAIAKAADISLEWLLITNGYTDLRDYICKLHGFNDLEVRFEGCTGFILDKTMMVDNNIVIGQTWDMSIEARDFLVIVKKAPQHGPRSIYLTTTGCLPLLGINEHKLAIGTTNLMANDSRDGVNYLFTISKALKQASYYDVTKIITETDRMSGHSFLCADGNISANLIETSAKDYLSYPVDHFPLVITNNYSNAMRKNEIYIPETRRRNSLFRYARAISTLVDRPLDKTKWSCDELWNQLLSDTYRSNSGGAICNQDYNGQYGEFATCATALLMPDKLEMWLCHGGAASGTLQVVKF